MAINLSDDAEAFKELCHHVHHKLACVYYGRTLAKACSVAIECEDCNTVLLSFDRPVKKGKHEVSDTV